MRHILTIILFSFFSFTVLAANFNTTGWKTYLSYNNTNSVEESNDQVFVVAEGSLYTYGKEDNSIKQYYKGNGLNDNTISLIRYNKQTKSLLIIYDNSNIDILEGGVATNLPYLSTSTSIRDKQINSVLVHDEYAYLSTAFGIVVINMAKKEIKDTYKLSLNITSCAIQNGNIYASTTNKAEVSSGIIYASLKENLLDKANWKPYGLSNLSDSHTISAIASFKNTLFYLVSQQGIFYENNGELSRIINSSTLKYMKVIGEKLACIDNSRVFIVSDTQKFDQINLSINDISTYQADKYWIAEGSKGLRSIQRKGSNSFEVLNEPIILDGPYSNSAFDIVCKNDKVYMIIGGKDLLNGKRFDKGGYILTYDYDKWSFIDPKEAQKKLNLPRNPRDYTSIAVTTDDSNDEIVYASSMGDGVIQYKNGTPVQSYNEKNAFKETAGGYGSGYCYIDGLAFDKNGNLWMTSSEVNHAVLVLDKAGAWHRLDIEQLRGVYTINDILITSTNDKWIYVPRNTPKLVMIPNSESLDEVSSYEFTTLIDTDGKELTPSNYTCVAEDKDGYIWVGTNRGAVYFTKPRISSAEDKAATRCTRVKYTNEETGNLAYFLDNVVVTTLKVDAGNRKWIGTKGNGVYVLDNDNETIVYQFNTTNSPLLSDNIYDIEINDKTGEVFIGTDKGLNSYQGEASEGKSDYSEIYAYPNPVRPEHMDKVTIVGLMDNSNVKITDLNGNIIYQTKSLGGQAIWNCRNANGSRVATGVYLVLASTEEASESVVTKIIVVK
ncbi:type IX secretion system anionic LPS delivery protein PorZ [Parabacteroides distasonis]|jgi:sugar lactone lactonase YvrE|uniref:T9SS C-terminal target domain-containing protein n=1 Tax=Parabacteroides distasonis TaxID=823 RepID=A0A3R6AX45_PARDI|nr:T9SS type A sorting domain-containing protein [Parabacteroides distasonis]RGM55440.1 T9SS C-terminal target domain-containing protein [Parabacteroides distasonis]RGR28642.1 T9SS C-terminal target domain-containing protein [Parabacteroides distasonis]RHB85210.1 T9SS C-terminal target domain-containing protein [Parabacteroides distasonis]RHD16265.1 T9SS C-terminal target domain-containing protein [Parabacteroides distasonis]RHD71994.1 T9SS C-terminal target domain-containing protein [Parabact